MIAAQHFAAELRRKNGCHTPDGPFLEICGEGCFGELGLGNSYEPYRQELRVASA